MNNFSFYSNKLPPNVFSTLSDAKANEMFNALLRAIMNGKRVLAMYNRHAKSFIWRNWSRWVRKKKKKKFRRQNTLKCVASNGFFFKWDCWNLMLHNFSTRFNFKIENGWRGRTERFKRRTKIVERYRFGIQIIHFRIHFSAIRPSSQFCSRNIFFSLNVQCSILIEAEKKIEERKMNEFQANKRWDERKKKNLKQKLKALKLFHFAALHTVTDRHTHKF